MNVTITTFEHGTWLESEEAAYPHGGQTRKGQALYPDGVRRRVHVGIADTHFSMPAHGRIGRRYVAGWVGIDDKLLDCPECGGDNWSDCDKCSFGLVDSPTRGALVFRVREGS